MMQRSTSIYIKILTSLAIAFTSVAGYPLQIRLDQNMYLRTENGGTMQKSGKLTKGSVVSIPDKDVVRTNGKIDLEKTLKNWGGKSMKYNGNQKEKFFPIQIVSKAPGSTVNTNSTMYMALDFLRRRGNATPLEYSVTETAETYTLLEEVVVVGKRPTAPAKTEGENSQCTNCSTGGAVVPPKAQEALKDIAEAVPATPTSIHEENSTPRFQGFNPPSPMCRKFIDGSGNYGPYGEIVLEELENRPEFMNAARSVRSFCPKFSTFSDEQKKNFWVWMLASMADGESMCDANAENNSRFVPNPPAVGLFQMEGRASTRRGRGLGSDCDGNMKDPRNNIQCTLAILNKNTLSKGTSLLGNKDQYWDVLRTRMKKGRSQQLIKQYSACRTGGR